MLLSYVGVERAVQHGVNKGAARLTRVGSSHGRGARFSQTLTLRCAPLRYCNVTLSSEQHEIININL